MACERCKSEDESTTSTYEIRNGIKIIYYTTVCNRCSHYHQWFETETVEDPKKERDD